ncbi:hypothetical protein [Parasitella parasitica]|uniref:PH domain-containing protein n=1 Tax=Parasitella parasitica TaxID=35722 RepID=A0A0B7NQR1_9FUNG|nr:hypothetical protein [Parasitella parasitica]
MKDDDYTLIGIEDPGDLKLLATCSKALKTHIAEKQSQKRSTFYSIAEESDDDDDFFSARSSSNISSNNDEVTSASSKSILKAIHAFDSYEPPSYPTTPPSIQANTPSGTMHLQAVPGSIIRRHKQPGGSRPVSMPVQLPSFATPPPNYSTSIYGRRLDRCRSMVFPREEEGKEELPGYSCTVFKMGYVNIKKEFDAPNCKSKYRHWRKLYVELWGTMLKVYRAPPSKQTSTIDPRNYYRWPLRIPYYYYHKYYYTPIFTISLAGAEAFRALDYFRRPNALRLTTQQGPQILMRLSSHVEMISWVEHLQAAINISLDLEFRPMPKFITIPTRGLTTASLDPRSIELERAREQRRRDQHEVLI